MKREMTSRARWRDKLEKPQEARIVNIPPKMSRFGEGTMLIPTPKLVDALIRKIPKGKLITVGELRRKLAEDFTCDVACPLTTGIFVRIASEAAEEDRAKGRQRITPYWRVVKDDGSLNPKFPGGAEQQSRYLRSEGFRIVKTRKLPAVQDFEDKLYRLR